ncbi:MAG TPA: ABC transporter permease [Cyclobacteriaceae bacterium]|jgi:putative ABC transport system permease protein|nr:ABC transporter permease [Cyclobacteriaceae bacterium]
MFKNYIKIAFRNLARNKVYSGINIFGLALGVACCLLLSLYIQDEMSYDKHHQRSEDIYRIVTTFQTDVPGLNKNGAVSPPIAMTMKAEIPEVEGAVRVLHSFAQSLIRYRDNLFYEEDAYLADSTLFDVLTYDLIEGNPKLALVQANSIVLSERLKKKLFGSEPALDKFISISQGGRPVEYKVTGVFSEKNKSVIDANFFTSMTSTGLGEYVTKDDETAKQWAGQNFVPSYLKLVHGHDKASVEKKMNEVLLKHGAEQMKALGIHKTLSLELLRDVYLKSDVGQSPRITYLYVVGSIAAFILLIACINFMNLSTAKATKRAPEIGIRKTLGAYRSSLISQILGEAMVIVVLSIVISLVLVQWILPFFNQLTDKRISFNSDNLIYFVSAAVLITVITGLVAGSYPAFYLSSFEPARVLKGKLNLGNSGGRLRQGLVVFQFMIAIALVCGIFVISNQMDFMLSKDLGFNSQAKIVLPLRTDEAHRQYDALKKELEKNAQMKSVSGAKYVPGTQIFNDMMFYPDGGNMDKAVDIRRNRVDVGYLELLNMKLIAGRSFTDNREMEKDFKLILNRTAVTKLGFTPEKIVGENLHFDWQGKKYDFEVIGVMEDFNQTSLHTEVYPTLFEMPDSTKRYDYIIASMASANFEETVKSVEQTWKSLISDTPFEYSFLDQTIQKQYEEDKRVSKIISSFAIIAMIICSLGLYGLSSYMAERRFKEIGIRKVMGANVQQIVAMMSTEFVKLVLIAFVIATPVAWWGMTKWLETFAFRTEIGWAVFAFAGLVALAIALVTVSFESIKSAMGNPVDSLRSE